MRREAEFFGEAELTLLYIAKRLKEALRLEAVLTELGIDYLVEPDTYRGGLIFVSERIGAFFYVPAEMLDSARTQIRSRGYKPYEPLGGG